MPKGKVAFLTTPAAGSRADLIMSLAPLELEVTCIDNDLPDDEKVPLCSDADAIMAIPPDVSVGLLRSCPKVRFIQLLSAGYDRIDVPAIGEMGIPIANNGGANAIAVAEQTIALMISICKKMMVQWHSTVNQRRWRDSLAELEMVEVTGKTVGIIGLGRIGKRVAKLLKGFDTHTIYHDILEMPEEVQGELNARPLPLDKLLARSDIVTVHVPLTSKTRGMIGEGELEMMQASSFLVNASRGPVVDERALYQALRNRRIAGAGLDVLEREPAAPDNPLFELDNVVITPHVAGFSTETNVRAANFGYANISRFLSGEPPESLIVPEK